MDIKLRICSLCRKELELSSKNFYKNKREIGGFDYRCKECKSIHYNSNKEKYKERSTNWQQSNKDKVKIISKKYSGSDKGIEKRKTYRKKEYKEKYGKDIEWTLLRNIRIRLNHALKNNFKTGKTLDLLGCSIEEFKLHLEKQFNKAMNWENYGTYWEVDHIKPCASFNLIDPIQQQECFHYTNTQPLSCSDNRSKADKLN
jgi:hypothetical protein